VSVKVETAVNQAVLRAGHNSSRRVSVGHCLYGPVSLSKSQNKSSNDIIPREDNIYKSSSRSKTINSNLSLSWSTNWVRISSQSRSLKSVT